jgi:hypothetical protein
VFEMAAPIQSPAKCEVRSVIRFLNAKGERAAEIHKQIVAVYDNVMNRQNVAMWCREFSEGRTHVHEEQRSGRPSLFSYDLLHEIEGEIRAFFCQSFVNCGLRRFGNDVMQFLHRHASICANFWKFCKKNCVLKKILYIRK